MPAIVLLMMCSQPAYTQQGNASPVFSTYQISADSVRTNPLTCKDNVKLWRGYVQEQASALVPAGNLVLPPLVDSTFRIRRKDLAPSIKLIGIN